MVRGAPADRHRVPGAATPRVTSEEVHGGEDDVRRFTPKRSKGGWIAGVLGDIAGRPGD
ncbi:hypothetical protein [Microbispora sp. NPDC049633]|uniref:hypothetical protein n=1 Tax=Microbispora sp. NPDC049633 TaxID=3154355 RepID=UPI0034302164